MIAPDPTAAEAAPVPEEIPREQLADGLERFFGALHGDTRRLVALEAADAALAVIRPTTDALQRVQELCDEAEQDSAPAYPPMWVGDVRAAIGGAR